MVAPSTREGQRAELHKTIWRIANDLRGSVDGWDFKTYVLGMLFYRFISENLTAYLNEQEREAGNRGLRLRHAVATQDAEFGRAETVARRASTSFPVELFANVRQRAQRPTRTSTRRSQRVFREHRGVRGRRRQRGRPQGPVRRPRRQLATSSARPSRKRNEKLREAARRDRRPRPRRLRRQHDRRVRRRLRVPDDDVRLGRRQVRRRVLHAAGGRPSCSPASPSSARPRSTRSTTRPAAPGRCC